MKRNGLYPLIASLPLVLLSCPATASLIDLGAAGPGNWAVLEIGNGNVSIANASNAGYINGNVGVANGGSIGDSGTPIHGNVVTFGNPALNPPVNPNVVANVSGSISQNTALISAAVAAANSAATTAAGLATSGGGIGFTVINFNDGLTHTLNPGVYNLTSLTLQNGTILSLNAGGSYVFNISGSLTLNSSSILAGAGLPEADILFDITGSSAVQFSGGLAQESVLHGIILAPNSNVQETPGLVVGEIISGGNISIASGAQVQGVSVPDATSTFFLLGTSLTALFSLRKKLLP